MNGRELCEYLQNFIGSRYQWGAEGPYNMGFDCSGFILEGLRAFGLWGKDDASSQMIHDKFIAHRVMPHQVQVGTLLFFGKDPKRISHIGIAISKTQYIEAGGGDSTSVDKGMVRIRPISWRSDLVGCIDIFQPKGI